MTITRPETLRTVAPCGLSPVLSLETLELGRPASRRWRSAGESSTAVIAGMASPCPSGAMNITIIAPEFRTSGILLSCQAGKAGQYTLWISQSPPNSCQVLKRKTSYAGDKTMRCIDCGAGMNLVEVAVDHALMAPGFEHHTFQCCACRVTERRLVFSRAGRSPTGRIVRIDRDENEGTYRAKDCRSGQIVLFNQDRERLWELCNWMGWRVSDGSCST